MLTTALVITSFLAITSPAYPRQEQETRQPDARSFFRIAESTRIESLSVGKYHRDRFFAPRLCGMLARRLGIPAAEVFRATALVLTFFSIFLMHKILFELGMEVFFASVMIAFCAGNPYFFRYYLSYTAMIPDLLCVFR
jgi:hypothetical protein